MVISFPVVPLEDWNPWCGMSRAGHRYERLPCGFARPLYRLELAESQANGGPLAGFSSESQTRFVAKKENPDAKSA